MKFRDWIRKLDEDVIQSEFGYEPGEFTVYPDHWRPLFKEGLTPREAWQRAMDAHREARLDREREKAENWARIQATPATRARKARRFPCPRG